MRLPIAIATTGLILFAGCNQSAQETAVSDAQGASAATQTPMPVFYSFEKTETGATAVTSGGCVDKAEVKIVRHESYPVMLSFERPHDPCDAIVTFEFTFAELLVESSEDFYVDPRNLGDDNNDGDEIVIDDPVPVNLAYRWQANGEACPQGGYQNDDIIDIQGNRYCKHWINPFSIRQVGDGEQAEIYVLAKNECPLITISEQETGDGKKACTVYKEVGSLQEL